jgi:hypothetical protein
MQMHAEDGSDSDTCQVRLEMTLPQDEVAEAAAVLARDPAKRILLASQGYALPESDRIMALFPVDAATLAIPAEQSLQVAPLGKLRASIEMQYALLTQARADIPVNSRNSIAWRQEFRDTQLQLCQARLTGSKGNGGDCACWVDGLSAQVSERQMDYLDYLTTNPYAQATGASRNFELIEERIKQVCGLNKRS